MSGTGSRIGGTISFTIDGTQYSARGSIEVQPMMVKREGIAGQDGIHGYTEMPLVPSIKGDFSTIPGLSLTTLSQVTNSTIQLSLANGSVYVLSNAWVLGPFAVNAAEGRFAAEFQGLSMVERTSTTTSTTS